MKPQCEKLMDGMQSNIARSLYIFQISIYPWYRLGHNDATTYAPVTMTSDPGARSAEKLPMFSDIFLL
jgi:hypothetical protein